MTTLQTLDTPAEPFTAVTAPDEVRLERLLPGPIDRVWSYIIDSDKRARWFAGGPMELREGGTIQLTWRNSDLSDGQTNPNGTPPVDGIDHSIEGVITRCEPPHRVAFNWSADGTGSETTFELSPEGADTRLVLTHRRLASHKHVLNVSSGWHVHVGILIDLLSGRKPRLFWPEHARLVEVYAARIGG